MSINTKGEGAIYAATVERCHTVTVGIAARERVLHLAAGRVTEVI